MMTHSPAAPGGTRYVQASCRTCGTKTLVFGDRPRPAACARCKAPFVVEVPPADPQARRPVPAR
jgi:ribosomal protein S27E